MYTDCIDRDGNYGDDDGDDDYDEDGGGDDGAYDDNGGGDEGSDDHYDGDCDDDDDTLPKNCETLPLSFLSSLARNDWSSLVKSKTTFKFLHNNFLLLLLIFKLASPLFNKGKATS